MVTLIAKVSVHRHVGFAGEELQDGGLSMRRCGLFDALLTSPVDC